MSVPLPFTINKFFALMFTETQPFLSQWKDLNASILETEFIQVSKKFIRSSIDFHKYFSELICLNHTSKRDRSKDVIHYGLVFEIKTKGVFMMKILLKPGNLMQF